MVKIFNPSAIGLNKSGLPCPYFDEVKESDVVFRKGDFAIVKSAYSHKHLYKNIIISETMGANECLIYSLIKDYRYKNVSEYTFRIAKERIQNARKYAEEYNFKLVNV